MKGSVRESTHILSAIQFDGSSTSKNEDSSQSARALSAASKAASTACQQQVKQRGSSHSTPRFAGHIRPLARLLQRRVRRVTEACKRPNVRATLECLHASYTPLTEA